MNDELFLSLVNREEGLHEQAVKMFKSTFKSIKSFEALIKRLKSKAVIFHEIAEAAQ